MIVNAMIFFIYFLLSVVERNPPVLVVYRDSLFGAPFHTQTIENFKCSFLFWFFEESILA